MSDTWNTNSPAPQPLQSADNISSNLDTVTAPHYWHSYPEALTYQVYFVIPRAMCPDSQMGILC